MLDSLRLTSTHSKLILYYKISILLLFLVGLCFPVFVQSEEVPNSLPKLPPAQDVFTSKKKLNETEVIEVLPTSDYVAIIELDQIPSHILEWAPENAASLYVTTGKAPVIYFIGTVKEGYRLKLNGKSVSIDKGRFFIRYEVPLETTSAVLRVIGPRKSESEYRILNHWIDIPPNLRVTVKEGERLTERAVGFTGRFLHSTFTQLYANDRPIQILDLDSQKHGKLSFRVLTSLTENYDGWVLVIRDSENRVVSRVGRYGSPPPFVDWREIGSKVLDRDVYSYQLNLFHEGKVYEGKINYFQSVEGYSLLNHRYIPWLQMEPWAGFAFYSFKDKSGKAYSNFAGTAELSAVLWNRVIVRGVASSSVHSLEQDNILTFTRIGVGYRFYGAGRSRFIGDPYILRVDVLFSRTGFTVYPSASIKRFTHSAILFDPHLLLWSYHYINPWVEFGARVNPVHRRISYGFNYYFYVRPWSLKVGLGFHIDKLYRFGVNDPSSNEFSVFWSRAGAAFFL